MRMEAKNQQRRVVVVPKHRNRIIMPIFLGSVIVFMMLLTAWVIYKKSYVAQVQSPSVVVERETIVNNPDYLTHVEGNQKFQSLEDRVVSLEEGFKKMTYRSWITAVAVNENATLTNKTVPQDYMKLDRDWKSNKIPETQILTPEQKEDLERGSLK